MCSLQDGADRFSPESGYCDSGDSDQHLRRKKKEGAARCICVGGLQCLEIQWDKANVGVCKQSPLEQLGLNQEIFMAATV